MQDRHELVATETAATTVADVGGWRRVAVRSFFVVFATVVLIDIAPRNWPWMRPVKQVVCPPLNYCGLWQGQWTLFAPNPILNNAWLSAEIYRPDGSQQEVWNSTYWANSSGWERFVGFRRMNYRNRLATASPEAVNDLADYLARQLISPTAHPVEHPVAEVATFGAPVAEVAKTVGALPPGLETLGEFRYEKSQPPGPETLGEFRYDKSQSGAVTAHSPREPTWRLVLTRSQMNIVLPDDGTLPQRDQTLWLSSSKNLVDREYLP